MFLMSRKCKTLREAMNGGYCYRKKRAADGSARYDEKPDKESKFSHVADGLQYVVVGSTGWKGGALSMVGGMGGFGGFQRPLQDAYQLVGGCDFGCA
jgi:hypothetical protein